MMTEVMWVKAKRPQITRDWLLSHGSCIYGAWESAASYGMRGAWDDSEDWCNLHGANRPRTLRRLRDGVKRGLITQAEYERMRDYKSKGH